MREATRASLVQAWTERQRTLLDRELREEREQVALLRIRCAPRLLERNGLALLNLHAAAVRVGGGGKILVDLERTSALSSSPQFTPHTLRPGDVVVVEEHMDRAKSGGDGGAKGGAPGTPPPHGLRGVIFRVSPTSIVVAVDDTGPGATGDSGDIAIPAVARVVKLANEVTYERYVGRHRTALTMRMTQSMRTVARLFGDAEPADAPLDNKVAALAASPLCGVLLGAATPAWDDAPLAPPLTPIHPRVNQTQRAAIEFALRARQVALIHGPPGTGKTTAVAELIVQLAVRDPHARILVCAGSNLAVDNVLERVLQTPGYREALQRVDAHVTRIGHPARVLSSLTGATLDVQSTQSDEGQLARDVARELNELMARLAPTARTRAGNKSSRTAPRPKGAERRRLWEQVRELRAEYRRRDRALSKSILQRARIVMATNHGAGGRQLHGMQFDVVVMDEACQALEASCWTAVLKLKPHGRLVLAGDHLQLPPTVKGGGGAPGAGSGGGGKPETAGDAGVGPEPTAAPAPTAAASAARALHSPTLETTLFDRLLAMYGDQCKALLSVQYRMSDEIMRFPNAQMYGGALSADASCRGIRIVDVIRERGTGDPGAASADDAATPRDEETWAAPLVFYDTTGTGMFDREPGDAGETGSLLQSQSRVNENEAALVEQHMALLAAHGVPAARVSVLSPYAAQVALLSTQLRPQYPDVETGTVDGMQGREKDVVIVSLVRSNEAHDVGFLRDKRRLNVAMTRARRQLVVVGDAETVAGSRQDATDARAFLRAWTEHLHEHAVVEMNPS
ncbi:DNA helicase [Malassezia sp. CBS 17886]|nr:DNA helicase [Malassezia sp. CBS 17886]